MYDRFSRYKFDKIPSKTDKDKNIISLEEIVEMAKKIFSELKKFDNFKSLIALVDKKERKGELLKKIINECEVNDFKNLIKIDAWKWEQYHHFNFLLFKYIINNISLIEFEKREELWKKIIVYLYTLNIIKNPSINEKVMLVMNSLKVDDPIKKLKETLISELESNNVRSSIVIIINNLQYCQTKNIRLMISFLVSIFKELKFFKLIFNFDEKSLNNIDFPDNWIDDTFDQVYNLNNCQDDKNL